MQTFSRFFTKSGLIFSVFLLFFSLAGCSKASTPKGGGGSNTLPQTDYQNDMEGRTEFPRLYFKVSPRLHIGVLSYDQTIAYTVDNATWDAGFTVNATAPINGDIELYANGTYSTDGTKTITKSFYDATGKKFKESTTAISSGGYTNLRYYGGGSQTLRELILFTKADDGTKGYIKLPPIHITITQ